MTDLQVRDEAMTIFLAGHETSANALAWSWYLLSQNPQVEAQLHDELDRILDGRIPQPATLRILLSPGESSPKRSAFTRRCGPSGARRFENAGSVTSRSRRARSSFSRNMSPSATRAGFPIPTPSTRNGGRRKREPPVRAFPISPFPPAAAPVSGRHLLAWKESLPRHPGAKMETPARARTSNRACNRN